MRSNNWEEQMLGSPKGLSPEVLCPSPERMDIDRVFQVSEEELDNFRRLTFPDDSNKNAKNLNFIPQTDFNKESDRLASPQISEDCSEYSQSEDYSKGNQKFKRQIPQQNSNAGKAKNIKKNTKKAPRKKRSSFRRIIEEDQGEVKDNRNLKSISKDVLAIIKSVKFNQTLSNDELAKKIMRNVNVDSRRDKNIRRRLYDAINVLQAIGIVEKVGGKIDANIKRGSYTMIQPLLNCEQSEQKIEEEIVPSYNQQKLRIERRIAEKTNKLNELKEKKAQLAQLIKRNSQISTLAASRNQIKKQFQLEGIDQIKIEPHFQRPDQLDTDFRLHFPFYMFETNDKTKFTQMKNMFAYSGSLSYAHSYMDLIKHISFGEKKEEKGRKIHKRRLIRKAIKQLKVEKVSSGEQAEG